MNLKDYREFLEAYQSVYEQQIGVPLKDASDRAAKQQLQKMIPKGEKIYTPKTTLQKAHYEPDGDLVDEQRVIDPPSSGGIELPFKSVDGLIKGGAASGIPNIPDNIKRTERARKMLDLQVKKQTPKPTTQVAHYEPDGDLVDEMNAGPSTPVKIDPKMGVVPNQGATRVGKVRLKPGTPASSLIKLADSCESDGELTEDLEERRKQLAQRRKEQIAGFRQRISDRVRKNKNRIAKKREREELKSEIKSELTREAVGDPISPNSVFKLSDPEVQKNLKSTMKPSGPAPMKPKVEKKPQQPASDRFVKRMVGSTMLSPL